jgi:Na+-translocating membrane potential-generating system MpsC-like protein
MRLKGVRVDPQHESQGPSAKIATSAVQVLHQYTGRGPTKAKTTINESMVIILLADTLTTGERTLVERGRADRVLQLRHDYQSARRPRSRKALSIVANSHLTNERGIGEAEDPVARTNP